MSELIQPRPSVMAFARAMEATLRKHDAKKGGQIGTDGAGWRNDSLDGLIDHAEEELKEIRDANRGPDFSHLPRVAEEAVDLGNMAMMIWDNCLQRPEAADTPSPTVQPSPVEGANKWRVWGESDYVWDGTTKQMYEWSGDDGWVKSDRTPKTMNSDWELFGSSRENVLATLPNKEYEASEIANAENLR